MNYLTSQSEKKFVHMLCGKYSNKKQSQAEPSLFANINIYFRLLSWDIFKGISIYSEQSYNHAPWSPYRQAVLKLTMKKDLFILDNYRIEYPERIAGAGFNPDLLKLITRSKLHIRENCEMNFHEQTKGKYIGRLKECRKCIIRKNGKDTYIISNSILEKEKFISKDEGFDIKTNKKVWGSENGYLVFERLLEP